MNERNEKQKILIVDDKPDNLYALETVLSETDARIVQATSGAEALRSTLHHDFALAILDVQMPGMDGYELAEYLRGDKRTQNLPIIFISAVYSDDHHVFKAYRTGAVDFVIKPYSSIIMLSKVRVFLQLDRQRRQLKNAIEVERAKNHLENILLSMTDGVMVVSAGGQIQMVNNALASFLGYEQEDIKGMDFTRLFKDPLASSWLEAIQNSAFPGTDAKRPFTDKETFLADKNGDTIPVLLSASPLQDLQGKFYGTVWVARDIRERVRTRKALQASEKKYRTLYETSRDGIFFSDIDGCFSDANPAFLNMTGYGLEALKTKNARSLTPDKWRRADREILKAQVLSRGYSDEYEKEYIRKDGTIFPVAVRSWLTGDELENPSGMWTLVRDMTENKMIELQRITTEKMTAVGMLAGGLAHELNNPLMGIHGFIEYCMKRTEKENKINEILADARRETKRCIDLVQNLLTFSHMGHQNGDEFENISCELIFDRVARLLSYRIEKEGVRLIKSIPEKIPEFRVKKNSLQQVFLNLITNALDAVRDADRKEIRFEVNTSAHNIFITFSDTGEGISSEDMKRIFDPFFTTKPVGKGTGLGLAVSGSIVEDHGGRMHCESQVGKGTRFIIELNL